jgi:hypothetical protein
VFGAKEKENLIEREIKARAFSYRIVKKNPKRTE